jgi:hypothetical protein
VARRRNLQRLEITRAFGGAISARREQWLALAALAALFAGLPTILYLGLNLLYLRGALNAFGVGKSVYAIGSPYSFFVLLGALLGIFFGPAITIGGARITLRGSRGIQQVLWDSLSTIVRVWPKAVTIGLALQAPQIVIYVAIPADNLAERWLRTLSGEVISLLIASFVGPVGAVLAMENPTLLAAVARSAKLVSGCDLACSCSCTSWLSSRWT